MRFLVFFFFFSFLFKEGSKLPLRAHLTDLPLYFRDRTWVTSPLLVKSGKIGCFCWLTPITAHPHRARERPCQYTIKKARRKWLSLYTISPLADRGRSWSPRVVKSHVQGHRRLCRRTKIKTQPLAQQAPATRLLNPLQPPLSPKGQKPRPRDPLSSARGMTCTKSTPLQK